MKFSFHRFKQGYALKPTQAVLVFSTTEFKASLKLLRAPTQKRVEFFLRSHPPEEGAVFSLPAQAADEADLFLAFLPKVRRPLWLLEFARDTLASAVSRHTKAMQLVFFKQAATESTLEAFGAALGARTFTLPVFGKRASKEKSFGLSAVDVLLEVSPTELGRGGMQAAFDLGWKTIEGTNLARKLAILPSNILNPRAYGIEIQNIAKRYGFSTKFYSASVLKKMGAGAFTAVDQANPKSHGGIWQVTYRPTRSAGPKSHPRVHLVGKGLCFDTGGYDIKVGGAMITMKGDMQGSSVALGTLVAAQRLALPFELHAYLAVTENHISPTGFKADDVVTALNGLTIEIVNTDAEGRMVLADALTLASRSKPDLVIDFATLTGSAVRAIGTKYSAGFTNRDELHDPIRKSGERSGERVWTFPTDETFSKRLESKVADTLQCLKAAGADHILAACFLEKFVHPGVPWVHLDLAASENEGGIGPVDSLFTGFGVRWAIDFIQSYA